jgi:hypothetical protein
VLFARYRRGDDVTYASVITKIRNQLRDDGIRIANTPVPFRYVWWPLESNTIENLLKSDYGITMGPVGLNDSFADEVKAIHDALDTLGHEPEFVQWQKVNDANARALYKSMNQRSTALSVWEAIAFPLRRQGDLIFRICAPRQVGGGMPIIDALPTDTFIRGVSIYTARSAQQLAKLEKQVRIWQVLTGTALLLFLLTILG